MQLVALRAHPVSVATMECTQAGRGYGQQSRREGQDKDKSGREWGLWTQKHSDGQAHEH